MKRIPLVFESNSGRKTNVLQMLLHCSQLKFLNLYQHILVTYPQNSFSPEAVTCAGIVPFNPSAAAWLSHCVTDA